MTTMLRYCAGVGILWLIYAGISVQEDVGVCEHRPCQNGGICQQHAGGFRCLCSEKIQNGRLYGGKTCTVPLSGCDDNPCENGGICSALLVHGEHAFLCGCLPGFAGRRCGTPTTFSFQGKGGHLRIETRVCRAQLQLTFSFRTQEPAGTLLQCRVGDLLFTVELLSGQLRLRSWRGRVSRVTLVQDLQGNVSDGEWHRVGVSLGVGFSRMRLLCAGGCCGAGCDGVGDVRGCYGDGVCNGGFEGGDADSDGVEGGDGRNGGGGGGVDNAAGRDGGSGGDVGFDGGDGGGFGAEGGSDPRPWRKAPGLRGGLTPVCQSLSLGTAGPTLGVWGEESLIAYQGCLRDVVVDSRPMVPGELGSKFDGARANVTVGCPGEDSCGEARCGDRGLCVTQGPESYRCVCHRPYHGADCQEEYAAASFGSDSTESYAEFLLVEPHPALASDGPPLTLTVSMFVRTKLPSGLLLVLANSSSQYLRVWLEEGRVKVQVNPSVSVTGRAAVDDGHAHLLTVELQDHVAVLSQASQIQASLTMRHVQAPRPGDRVFVGGLPDPEASVEFGGHFRGCVQDLRINGRTLRFFPLQSSAPEESHRLEQRVNVIPGCGSDDDEPCAGKLCLNGGACQPAREGFSCICPPGMAGRRCEEVRWCEWSPCPSSAACQTLPHGFQCLSNVTLRSGASHGCGILSYRGNGRITRRLASVLLRLRTLQADATLLQARQGPARLLNISLRRSHLAMELLMDGGPTVSVRTAAPVADGRWHTIRLRMETPAAERSRWVVEEEDDGRGSAEARLSDTAGGSLDFLREGVDILVGIGDSGAGGLDGCLGPLEIGGILLPFHSDQELSLPRPQEEQFLLGGAMSPPGRRGGPEGCSPNPCLNRGTCENLLDQDRPDPCLSDPCLHGRCTPSLAAGGYECTCAHGYTGSRCEVEVDTCADHRCGPRATCLRGLEGYGCLCGGSMTGRYCTEKRPEIPWYVETKPFPRLPVAECQRGARNYSCFHGGACSVGDPICHCPAGFTGHWCEIDVDECASSPCMHDGICLDQPAGWECACGQTFSGLHCQVDVNDFYLYLFLALWQNFFQLFSYQMLHLDDGPEVEWEIRDD